MIGGKSELSPEKRNGSSQGMWHRREIASGVFVAGSTQRRAKMAAATNWESSQLG